MERIKLSKDLSISRIVHGYWRLIDWNMPIEEVLKLLENAYDLGITTVDHADIYGSYLCEERFDKFSP